MESNQISIEQRHHIGTRTRAESSAQATHNIKDLFSTGFRSIIYGSTVMYMGMLMSKQNTEKQCHMPNILALPARLSTPSILNPTNNPFTVCNIFSQYTSNQGT